MLGLRTAYKGDFDHGYQVCSGWWDSTTCLMSGEPLQSWLRNEEVPSRAADVARDRKILSQVQRWVADVEGNQPRLQPREWTMGMIEAMAPRR
jgi:hypothetical protein